MSLCVSVALQSVCLAMIAKFVLCCVSFRFSYLTRKMFYVVVVETYTPVFEGEIGVMVATLNL